MAFCVAIKKRVNDICVLRPRTCMWQDRVTNECKYTREKLDVSSYCKLVHQEEPSKEVLEQQKIDLIKKVKENV